MNSLNETKASRSKILLSYLLDLMLHLFTFLLLETLVISNITSAFPVIKNSKKEIVELQNDLVDLALDTKLLRYDENESLLTLSSRINEEIPKLVKTSAIFHKEEVRGNKFLNQEYYENNEDNPVFYYIFVYKNEESSRKQSILKENFSSYLIEDDSNIILNLETTKKLINYIFLEDYKNVINFRDNFYEDYSSLFSSLIKDFEENDIEYKTKINEIDKASTFFNTFKSIEIIFSYVLSFLLINSLFNLIKKRTIGEKINKIQILRKEDGVILKKDLFLKDLFYLISNSFLIIIVISFSFNLSNLIKLSYIGYFLIFISIFSSLLTIFNLLFILNKTKNPFINYILKLEYFNY